MQVGLDEAERLALAALERAGASALQAAPVARSIRAAEAEGVRGIGLGDAGFRSVLDAFDRMTLPLFPAKTASRATEGRRNPHFAFSFRLVLLPIPETHWRQGKLIA